MTDHEGPIPEGWAKALMTLIAILIATSVTLIYIGRWWGATETKLETQSDSIEGISRKLDDKVLPMLGDHERRIETIERDRDRR